MIIAIPVVILTGWLLFRLLEWLDAKEVRDEQKLMEKDDD